MNSAAKSAFASDGILKRNSRLPSEILAFLAEKGGRSMILRGNAGTGKTTLALQLVEELRAEEKCFYLSTRVSDASLISQFPWLKEKILEGSIALYAAHHAKEGHGKTTSDENGSDRVTLESAGISEISKKHVVLKIGNDLEEVEILRDIINRYEKEKVLIIIDSIDALAQRYGKTCADLITTIQSDFVECRGVSVLFVLESADTQLDYLADGVVLLKLLDYRMRRIREIEIKKLRGFEIEHTHCLFSLSGGRVRTFGTAYYFDLSERIKWKSIKDSNGLISFGIGDMDRLLGGGVEKGSIVLIEFGYGIPTSVSLAIEKALVFNFVSQGRGVIWMPMRKASAETLRNRLSTSVGEVEFDEHVRIPEKATHINTLQKYLLPIEGESAAHDLSWQNLTYALQTSSMPLLSLMGFDTLESIYGDKVVDQLTDHLTAVRKNNAIFVGMAPSSASSLRRIADLATVHIRIDTIRGTVVVYGEKPFTACYGLEFEEKTEGSPISLVPIV
ncbi:MAG: gas vesicle protein GvpD P-loop domain-containing protein [Methanomassiliicoccales archaeon]